MRKTKLIQDLLSWYDQNARDLPWRRTRDPYAIWVSEVMLQQTRVQAVLPYWRRWMKALPSIAALAQARTETVHRLWAGLGYYTRARNLHRAARQMVEKHQGRFPDKFEHVFALPGIGRYTAGAICSIAFDQPRPILDGNVMRVLSRTFGIEGNPRHKAISGGLWALAEDLVQRARKLARPSSCSRFNQSLMELGALICIPRNPHCAGCPVRLHCTARREGRVAELPEPPSRPRSTQRRFAAFVVERNSMYLVRRRAKAVVNGNLWEFPNTELFSGNRDLMHAALNVLGSKPNSIQPALTIKHTITRYRITMEVYCARLGPQRGGPIAGTWHRLHQLKKLPFPSAHQKVLQWLGKNPGLKT